MKIYISLFVLAISCSFGRALECYSCDSSKTSLCNFGLLSFVMPTVDCSKATGDEGGNLLTSWIPKQCVKLTAKDKDGNNFVARGCIPYSGGACNIIMSTLGFFSELAGGARDVNCYTCDGDKCNSSFVAKPSLAITTLLSVIFLFFKL